MDDIDLAQSLRGSLGGGTTARRVSSPTTTTTIAGTATGDSANGVVSVRIDGQGTGTGDDGSTEIATTANVREGDRVIVTLIGADGTGKHPVVTGVVGRGDEQQAQMEAEAVARQSAINQKADEITASVAESYATKDALNGEVTSRESIVRQTTNGVEVAKKVNGSYTGTKAVIDDDSFDIQGQDGTVYSSFGASKVELGKNSAAAVIELCNGNGKISTADTWTSIESPKTGNLELKSGVGTEQQAFVRVSGGDRPQVSLVRTDGIADADSVIQMSGSGITINGGEKGVTTGRIKLGGGAMLKAVYIGTWVGKMSAGGDATIISAADAKNSYNATNHNGVFLPMNGDTDIGYEIQLTGWQGHDGSFGVRANVTNRTIRVNWLLVVGV